MNDDGERFRSHVDAVVAKVTFGLAMIAAGFGIYLLVERGKSRRDYEAMLQVDSSQTQRLDAYDGWLTSIENRMQRRLAEHGEMNDAISRERGRGGP